MIHSMTAFARREARTEWGTLAWELRSLNHRYLEIALRLPEELRGLDGVARERIAGGLRRGKLDAGLRFTPLAPDAARLEPDEAHVRRLLDAAGRVRALLDDPAPVDVLAVLQWPGVLKTPAIDPGPLQQAALELLDETLAELQRGRAREGDKLAGLVRQRLEGIGEVVRAARERLPELVDRQRERLRARLAEAGTEALDPGRLEQEIVLLAHKLDVAEELDRLETHVQEVRRVLEQRGPVGRRLDFLMQELNREANTLGAKSADTRMTAASVELKVLIEQMREQVQNIE